MNEITRKEFSALVARVAKLEVSPKAVARPKKPQAMREFFLEKNPKSQNEKAICLIYYNEHIKNNVGGVGSKWLKEKFKHVKEKPPGNLGRVLIKCCENAWIDSIDDSGTAKLYTITNTGIEYVDSLPKTSK